MPTVVKTFNYTGTLQQATIPAGSTSIDVYLWAGAGGGGGSDAGGPGGTGAAASDAASHWRAKGYTAEAFVDAAGRPAWRDRILRSSGYREARLLCTHGELAVLIGAPAGGGAAAADRATGKPVSAGWTRLIAGEWATLSIGIAHELRNAGDRPTSWVYVMR